MTTLAEFMIIAGADNRPPMLEKSMYDSRKSRMELYIENRENERMILNSVLNGPLVWPTVDEENGTTRTKKYEELLVAEKLQVDCDLKATNIVLQGLPKDVYAIVNHHKVSREIWDRVKLPEQGTKMSLQEKESIGSLRFPSTKNQPKTSSNLRSPATIQEAGLQCNKFKEKAMLAEAQESDQILDEEQLAFLANPSIPNGQAAQITIPNTATFKTENLDAYDSDCDDVSNAKAVLMANLSNYGFDIILEKQNRIFDENRFSSIPRPKVVVQNLEESQRDDHSDNIPSKIPEPRKEYPRTYNEAMQSRNIAFWKEAIHDEIGSIMGNDILSRFTSNHSRQHWKAIIRVFKYLRGTKDYGLSYVGYPSMLEDAVWSQMKLRAGLDHVSHDVYALFDHFEDAVWSQMKLRAGLDHFEGISHAKSSKIVIAKIVLAASAYFIWQERNWRLFKKFKRSVKQVVDCIASTVRFKLLSCRFRRSKDGVHYAHLWDLLDTIFRCFYDDNHKQALGYQNLLYLKKAQRIKPTLYDGRVISSQHIASSVIDDKETLILKEVSRNKINYVELNRLSEDFGKHFVPQQELSDEQAFWLQTSHPNTDQSASSTIKIKAPKEPPKTLKDIFNAFDKDLLNEVTEVQTIFNQMETAVEQCSIDKQCFQIHKKELFLENDRLLHKIMSQDVMICVMNSTAIFEDVNLEMQSSELCVKCLDLDVERLNKQNAYNDLLKSLTT
uniref:Reverse transcriptase domain, reverse transcriptase zinc-binding domain protein n=1 Tax=Tanacetum cinerariifolium TaxID=118510 RepID=A0A6L2JJF5_TANCI|nr:reverse transcriptase domain, reverse transcriptase zinc-binding domain protein [Tanacetum cinerariifolium]